MARMVMNLHPAIILGIAAPVILGVWRLMPSLELALAAYAWGLVALALLLNYLRPIPDGAIGVMVLIALGSSAAIVAGDAHIARFMFGLNIVALLVVVWHVADDWFWWAFFLAGCTELASWLLGNANRGTFGADVAQSAIGQAYGEWAWPAQLLLITLGYAYAARRATTAR